MATGAIDDDASLTMVDESRRNFFRLTAKKAARFTVKELEAHVEASAEHWIRPPYVLAELDFLLACTRCGECVQACPHDVVFALSSRLGAIQAGTPALDLNNKGCHLCEDWPCVSACAPAALLMPVNEDDPEATDEPPLPQLAQAFINMVHCLPYQGPECGACAHVCPVEDALVWDMAKPHIDLAYCTGCGLCREACIVDPKAVDITAATA